jgi:hypothetical protein
VTNLLTNDARCGTQAVNDPLSADTVKPGGFDPVLSRSSPQPDR